MLALPTVLIGTAAEIADRLIAHRAALGVTYFTVREPTMEQFGAVITELANRGALTGLPPDARSKWSTIARGVRSVSVSASVTRMP